MSKPKKDYDPLIDWVFKTSPSQPIRSGLGDKLSDCTGTMGHGMKDGEQYAVCASDTKGCQYYDAGTVDFNGKPQHYCTHPYSTLRTVNTKPTEKEEFDPDVTYDWFDSYDEDDYP